MKRKLDKYDRAIQYLKRHPEAIADAWYGNGTQPKGEALFKQVSGGNGRPTFIHKFPFRECNGPTFAITRQMKKDRRLDVTASFITKNDLKVFAMWQRRCDRAFQKKGK